MLQILYQLNIEIIPKLAATASTTAMIRQRMLCAARSRPGAKPATLMQLCVWR